MLRRLILLAFIVIAVIVVAAVAAVILIDPDDYREQIAERASAQIGREVQLDGPIELKLFPWLSFQIRDAGVANPADFEAAPRLAEIGLATASIRLWPLIRGEIEIGAVEFENSTFNLVTDRAGRSNLDGLFAPDPDPGRDRPPVDLSGFQTGPVRLSNVVIALIDLASGERNEIVVDAFDMAPFGVSRAVSLSLRGAIMRDGEPVLQDLHFDGVMRVPADVSSLTLDDWQARFELPGADARGRISGDMHVDLGAAVTELKLSSLAAQLSLPDIDLALNASEPVAVRLADEVEISMPAALLDLGDQRLRLAGDLQMGDLISGRLAIGGERLDLRALAALGGGDEDETPSGEAPDFRPLQMLDFHSSLQLEELVLAEGMRLNSVEAEGRLQGGVFELDPMQAQLFGGRFDGSARVDFNQVPPTVRLQPRLSGIQVEELAGLISDHAPIAGIGDLTLDLSFRGLALADILASLDGDGQFDVSDGAVRGIDLNRLIEQELAVSSLSEVRGVFSGETPFRQLSGRLTVDDGVIGLPDLNLTAEGFGARGSGQFDFAADQVDYRIELDLGESLQARLPRRLREATGGRIPLAIAGPITAPVVTVDLVGIAERTVRDEIGRRLLDRLERDREAPEEPAPPETDPPPPADSEEADEASDDEPPAPETLLFAVIH